MPRPVLGTPDDPAQDTRNHVPYGVHTLDAEGTLVFINDTELRWLGYAREELVGKVKLRDLLTEKSRKVFDENLPHLKAEGWVRDLEVELVCKDGAILPVLLTASSVSGALGESVMSRTMLVDEKVSRVRKEAPAETAAREPAETLSTNPGLRHGELEFRRLLEAAPDAILEIDAQGKILLVNEAAERMFGYPRTELVGMNVEALVPQASRGRHARHRAEYSVHPNTRPMGIGLELKAQRKDGTLLPVEISLSPNWQGPGLNVIAIVRDITERVQSEEMMRRSEERLRQAEKLEALARLAGGTAHEFNNLLTMILGYAELLQPTLTGARSADYVDKIRVAAKRAADLTRKLLAVGRKQVMMPQVLDLNLAVSETARVLSRVIGESVTTAVVPAPQPAWVRADATQIEQMIANLVINAREAMPQGGKLTLALESVDLNDEHLVPGLPPGAYIVLHVSDTGVGMPPEVQARVFEPFFSTRQFGKAAGLGLATVYGIASQSGGTVLLSSRQGEGTTFSVYLPRVSDDEVARPQAPQHSPDVLRGSETVLLVEDQPHLLALSREFLEELGYKVLAAGNGEEALRAAQAHAGEIDLLLTDVVMPEMNGRQLAMELRRTRPSIKVLYVSGYTDEVFGQDALEPEEAFMEKPFELESLALEVRRLIESGSPRPA